MSTNINFTPPTGATDPVKRPREESYEEPYEDDHYEEESYEDDFEKVMVVDYVRKPLYVRAVRVDKNNMEAVARWCGGEIEESLRGDKFIRIAAFQPQNDRQNMAIIGDWVTMTRNESVKSYTNKAFRRTFDFAGNEKPIKSSPPPRPAKSSPPVVVAEPEVIPKKSEKKDDDDKLLLRLLAKKFLEDD